jgi:intein/homing endonuclease
LNNETINATPEHPFYVPAKGWTSAVNLRAGDVLYTLNGEYVVVEKVQHEILEKPVWVYNFEVADDHTYFVGENAVGVHNECDPDTGERIHNISRQDSPIWNEFDNYRNGIKSSGSGSKKRYYEWDYTHNDIEVYDKNGRHIGSMDPRTGDLYKPPVRGRDIKI